MEQLDAVASKEFKYGQRPVQIEEVEDVVESDWYLKKLWVMYR